MAEIDQKHIELRVSDWKERVAKLYHSVESRLASEDDFSVESNDSVSMNEELMVKFNVPSTSIPKLNIYRKTKLLMSIKPVGLWIIGGNGRLDIMTKKGAYILVDFSEFGDKESKWKLFSPTQRRQGENFTPELLLELATKL
ncbi:MULTISPECIES: hypothetical protein [Pseudoalteromonas]|uniref:hypothetical protein n=1 Tax=Pseudoalteromonas TaxID=53246 RepID=UPI0011086AD3|nr:MULTISPECIES: hypothetical protein [Pseudoalteromonas]MCG9758365.1 hypothetical protein [Pseudoalteromonas sp. Isolate6]NKC20208.1 hypothetical protein [Pseudoalteromonas galatheae]